MTKLTPSSSKTTYITIPKTSWPLQRQQRQDLHHTAAVWLDLGKITTWLGLVTKMIWVGLGKHCGLGSDPSVTFLTYVTNVPTK